MAVYDLGPTKGQRMGEALGSSIGNTIGDTLSALANAKSQQLQHRSLASALQHQGIPNAPGLATLLQSQPKAGLEMLKFIQEAPQREQKQRESEYFAQLAGNIFGAPQQQVQQQTPQVNIPTQASKSNTGSIVPQRQPTEILTQQAPPSLSPGAFGQLANLEAKQKANQIAEKRFAQTGEHFEKKLAQSGEQFQQSHGLQKETLEERKRQHEVDSDLKKEKKQLDLDKMAIEESRPYIEAADSARRTKGLISQARQVLKKGKPSTGFFAKIADDLKITGLTGNTDTELLSKIYSTLALDFGKALPAGSRGNVFFEQSFQKTVPQLGNSKEGALAILDLMEFSSNAIEAQNDARKEILRDNGGKWTQETADDIRERSDEIQSRLIQKTEKKLQHYKNKNIENSGQTFNKGSIDASKMPVGFLIETKDGRRLRLVDPKTNKWESA